MTLGHGVWFNERDIEMVAAAGARICHNASSNLRLRSGIAPLNAFHRCGVECGIGMDEAGINDDRDMLQEMRVVLNVHRVPGMDDTQVPTAAQVLRMATEHGARTTPFGAEIGTLEVGKAADLVLLDWRQIAYPYLALDAEVTVIDAIVHRAKAKGVKTVMVAGETIYRDGRFTKVDKDAAIAALAEELAQPRTPAEEARLRLSRAVAPHVRRFYEQHLDGEIRDPFYRQNARV
jgi:5-methylthioadenosine/S-adenosylhomocysteine deaminase